MGKKMYVEDRERIEAQIQENKTRDLREMQKKRDDDKWDINQMSEFDFVRCDYSA